MDMKKGMAAAAAEADANHRRDASLVGEQNSEPSSMASEDTAAEESGGGVASGGGAAAGRDHDMADAASSAAASASVKTPSSRQRQPQPQPPRARAPVARRRRRAGNAARDIVLLNVGGTVFTTSAATLTSDSSYFKSMFSDRWASEEDQRDDDDGDGDEAMMGMGNGGGDGEYISAGPSAADVGIHRGGVAATTTVPAMPFPAGLPPAGYGGRPSCPTCNPQQDHYGQHHRHFVPRPEPIFIDQDARPFSLLLTYMRGGGINLLESDVPLARQVMLQAQFFGVEGFLRVVKARAYRHNFEDFAGSDDKAVANFDKTYGGLDEAISEGILPDAYFRPMPDHVVINAGGTTFETSKRTLTERSPYFESLFKRSPRERTYFLDVDPSAFGILLKYMRHAEFDLPRSNVALFRCVLALAQRFEIRGFIEYVKARTYAIQSGHDPREWLTFLDRHHHPIEDSDNADAFNENYEGVDEAFVTGILPDGFFEKRET